MLEIDTRYNILQPGDIVTLDNDIDEGLHSIGRNTLFSSNKNINMSDIEYVRWMSVSSRAIVVDLYTNNKNEEEKFVLVMDPTGTLFIFYMDELRKVS